MTWLGWLAFVLLWVFVCSGSWRLDRYEDDREWEYRPFDWERDA